jgi:tryptophan 2,3-dioxygenase
LHLLTFFGYIRGTGSALGVAFLRARALDLTFLPDLFDVRTEIAT